MKKTTLIISAILLFISYTNAQETKKEHTIKVVGTAELEIVPDEIFMTVNVQEYTKDKKKFTIEDIEKSLINFLKKITSISENDVKMDNMDACIIKMKRKNKDEVITKKYEVKFKNSQQVYQLYSVMDSLGITNAFVNKYSHSKMDEYKKQIKINAIKAARDKANYLLEAIGERAGKAISVAERTGYVNVDDGTNDNNYRNSYSNSSYGIAQSRSNARFLSEDGSGNNTENTIGGKTIKLHYDLDVEFAIQ